MPQDSYTTAGVGPYSITFPYLKKAHVSITLDDVSSTAYTISGSSLTLDATSTGAALIITRTTPIDLVQFVDGATLSSSTLETARVAGIYRDQEADDIDDTIVSAVEGVTARTVVLENEIAEMKADVLNVRDFGAIGDAIVDDTVAIQDTIDAAVVTGGTVHIPTGTYKITAALVITATLQIQGDSSTGSIISNTTNDVHALLIQGSSPSSADRADRVRLRDFQITHEAPTEYAVRFDNAAYGGLENVVISCNSLGYGGVLFGDELSDSASSAYLGFMRDSRVIHYTDYGVRVNSRGTTWNFTNCYVNSTVDGADGGFFNVELVHVDSGQWGATNNGGIALHFYNTGPSDNSGGSVRNLKFEDVRVGAYGVVIDGTTNSFVNITLTNLGANLSVTVVGTLVKFQRAKLCQLIRPSLTNVGSGGTLVEWGQFSRECTVECDPNSSAAPIIVHASAFLPVKTVYGIVYRTSVASVTTASGLRTTLVDGIDDLPTGFLAVHNGTAWNFAFLTSLGDDEAVTITPPTIMGRITVMDDRFVSTFGSAAYEVTAGACERLCGGSDFEVATGVLTGTTGSNLKMTISAHTDGSVYVESRYASSNVTVIFDSLVYGV
ncbi:phage tail fiber protein [Myxococcota bacterium]|nr:phage tail fiber protein [Myxococcota bacterium]